MERLRAESADLHFESEARGRRAMNEAEKLATRRCPIEDCTCTCACACGPWLPSPGAIASLRQG